MEGVPTHFPATEGGWQESFQGLPAVALQKSVPGTGIDMLRPVYLD
jgi:hypothetical protein